MRYSSVTDRLAALGGNKWAVHVEGRRRLAAGQPVIMLSIGEPDVAPPATVLDTAITSMRSGRTKYAPGQGEPRLRRAIAAHYTARSGLTVDAADVVATAGTQHALFTVMSALADPGDEVLVPDPYYATYDGVVAAVGATFVAVPTSPDDRFHLTAGALAAAVTPASRVLLLNTPSNPTGAVLSMAEIDAIGEVCIANDLWIMCDEVYATMTYDCEFASPFDRPALRERSVSVASISKSHALPGFRSGWAVCPSHLAPRVTQVVDAMMFGSQPFLADAAAVALSQEHPEVGALRDTFRRRAEAVVGALSGSSVVHTHMPEGGMFMMIDVRETGLSGVDFAWRLLDEEGVVVMPGESFGTGAAGHLRVALTVDVDTITEACRRIVACAESVAVRS